MDKCQWHEAHESRISKNEASIDKIYELLEKVRNRLPNWATIGFAVLSLVVGWLLRYGVKL